MKGGKQGRKRKSSTGNAARAAKVRGKPAKGDARRPPNAAPRKGARKRTFGALPTSADD